LSCSDGKVVGYEVPEQGVRGVDPEYASEHIVELQTMKLFLMSVYTRELPDGTHYNLDPIYCDFIIAAFDQKASQFYLPEDVPQPYPQSQSRSPIERIVEAQGTYWNWKAFVLLEEDINFMKARVSLH
jgi:hypothetical protein